MPPEPAFHRFLDLPPELRTHIYSHLLEMQGELFIFRNNESGPFKARYRYSKDTLQAGEPVFTPGLLRTSRLVHKEATPILYGNNKFGASWTAAPAFLEALGSSIQHLQHFFLGYCTSADFPRICGSLVRATSLKTFATPAKWPAYVSEFTKYAWCFIEALYEAQKNRPEIKERNVLDVIKIDLGLLDPDHEMHRAAVYVARQFETQVREMLEEKIKEKESGMLKD